MRVVLDPNVLVSALISGAGPSREIVDAWTLGHFELVASPALLAELRDVLARPRFRRWVALDVAEGDALAAARDLEALVGARRLLREPRELGPRFGNRQVSMYGDLAR